MHPDELKNAVQNVMVATKRSNPFTNNRSGNKWKQMFLTRQPAIAKRNAEVLSKARACVTEESIRDWFKDLKDYLAEEVSRVAGRWGSHLQS